MGWSIEQEQAIDIHGKDILVAAAAGSGKTSVLVERVIRKIISGKCNINEILLVTFTNAAASEMRERISLALEKQLTGAQLEYQAALFAGASISTLHSFCQNIIRQYFHLIDLDPQFRLATEQETLILRHEVFEELLDEYYAQGEATFLELVDCYGDERGDSNLYEYVNELHRFALAQPFPRQWLEKLPSEYKVDQDIEQAQWFLYISEKTVQQLEAARLTTIQMRQSAIAKQVRYAQEVAEGDLAAIDEFISLVHSNWDEFCELITGYKFSTFRLPKEFADYKEEFKKQRQNIKDSIKTIADKLSFQKLSQLREQLPLLERQSQALIDFVLDFDTRFSEAKRQRNIIDFNDLEHLTMAILYEPESTMDHLVISDIAKEYQRKFKEIMVDEYQDTNGVQEAILQAISNPDSNHLFVVGDVKQSIYRFRLADPGIFLDKYQAYPHMDTAVRIDLAANYRSRWQILEATNFIFEQLMTSTATELAYGKKEALKAGLAYPDAEGVVLDNPAELCLVEEAGRSSIEAEAHYIASRIRELFQKQTMVYDKHTKEYRPICYRDIAILMRTTSSKGQIVAQILQEADIPVYASLDSGYFQEVEIRIMLALLQIIDNPLQDIPLTAVLYSSIGQFTETDLTYLRLYTDNGSIFQAMQEYSELLDEPLAKRCQEFLHKLTTWRYYARRHSVPELIWKLLHDTGYYDYVGTLIDGNTRQANLRALYDRASVYERTSYRGLFRFLQFVKRMQSQGNDLAIARTLGEAEDVVRIMTIHKSKGLEFPVVFLPDVAKQFNLQDTHGEILCHKDLGIGLYAYAHNGQVKYDNLIRRAIAEKMLQETKAEELRVLYVAMTRAREQLIITGAASKSTDVLSRALASYQDDSRQIRDYAIVQSKSYLDWLLLALLRHPQAETLQMDREEVEPYILDTPSQWNIRYIKHEAEEIIICEDVIEEFRKRMLQQEPLPHMGYQEDIARILNWEYQPTESAYIPAKLSVSEIKSLYLSQIAEDDISLSSDKIFQRPQFIQEATKLTGAERGLIMHSVMQHLDLSTDVHTAGIKRQVDRMIEEDILTAQQAKVVNWKQISAFFTTKLGQLLRQAKRIERELHFGTMLDVSELIDLQLPGTDTVLPQGSEIFVQGIIDLLFQDPRDNSWIILDYKTDKLTAEEAMTKYSIQLQLYARVMKNILPEPVKAAYLYLFRTGEIVEIPLSS